MKVKIRLARWGAKHNSFFGIVAAPVKFARDGRHLERLGTYNPRPYKEQSVLNHKTKIQTKHVELNVERIKYWIAVGAQPTSKVAWLLEKAGLMPPTPKQLQNQGLISMCDKRHWDVAVKDISTGKDLCVLGADQARELFVKEGLPTPEGIEVDFRTVEKVVKKVWTKKVRINPDLVNLDEKMAKVVLDPSEKLAALKTILRI